MARDVRQQHAGDAACPAGADVVQIPARDRPGMRPRGDPPRDAGQVQRHLGNTIAAPDFRARDRRFLGQTASLPAFADRVQAAGFFV